MVGVRVSDGVAEGPEVALATGVGGVEVAAGWVAMG
jgi:hypothetical protein